MIALLAGIGALLAVFGRWNWLGWHGRDQQELSFRAPDRVALTPSQKATAGFFLVMAALFLVQTLVGVASQHYRAEIGGFFGIDSDRYLPFNIVRTWHVQLSIFWVVTSFLAAGIFLTPMIAGRKEPRGQHVLANLLLGALVVVVVGSLLGELAGSTVVRRPVVVVRDAGVRVPRPRQVLADPAHAGLAFWVVVLWRGLRSRLASSTGRTCRGCSSTPPWPFRRSTPSACSPTHAATFAVADFWRFVVVHLWVEDFLELFTTVMVAYMFVLLGVVRQRVAMTVIFLDIILYSAGGVIGMAHHLYFNGEPAEVLALGAFFSALEVIPLTFLTLEAWTFLQLGARQESSSPTPFPHRWAVMFLVSVGFWNFLGAGVFGFLINLPIVSYYEIGTALTANHSHAAMMGVYGMLAVGFMLFCLRYLVPEDRWSDKLAKISFWSLNIGLAWMCFVTLLPLGVVQLHRSVSEGYWAARELNFLTNDLNALLGWLRLPGDVVFIGGGVLPLLWIGFDGVRHRGSHQDALDDGDLLLFTEVTPASDDPSRSGPADHAPRSRLPRRVRPRPEFVAVGLESLGRRSTDPWASRTLAASKPPADRPRRDGPEWPDSEVATFHLGLSAVALAAAFVITTSASSATPAR